MDYLNEVDKDFTFRFSLKDNYEEQIISSNVHEEVMKCLLKGALEIVTLTYRGQEAKVDGFRFQNSLEIYKLY